MQCTSIRKPCWSPHQTVACLPCLPRIMTPHACRGRMQYQISACMCAQISHTFFDAPGAQAATFIEGKEADPASLSKPYVTMVFCGPADYKVNYSHASSPPPPPASPFTPLLQTSLVLEQDARRLLTAFHLAAYFAWTTRVWPLVLNPANNFIRPAVAGFTIDSFTALAATLVANINRVSLHTAFLIEENIFWKPCS